MKFALFVEGHTEKESLPGWIKRWLDPRLPQPVGVHLVRFEGSSDYLRKFARRAKIDLEQGNLLAVVGLLDLYGSGLPYPPGQSLDQTYTWAKGRLQAEVGNERFVQHFAVHETEAWLLSAPSLFPREIERSFPGSIAQPETVNFDEPPSKLLKRLYRNRLNHDYKKRTDGHDLFSRLDPEVAYQRCPHLRALFDDLLRLAQAPGV